MTRESKPLSNTARRLLTLASTRPDHLVRPPDLPLVAARQVIRSMLTAGLVEEISASIEDATYVWRLGEGGVGVTLRATALGLSRIEEVAAEQLSAKAGTTAHTRTEIGVNPEEPKHPSAAEDLSDSDILASSKVQAGGRGHDDARVEDNNAPAAPNPSAQPVQGAAIPFRRPSRQATLRQAAQDLVDAWDVPTNREQDLVVRMDGPIADLRAVLASHATVRLNGSSGHKNTKGSAVLAMLRREEGASGPAIAKAMGWAPHTVRGFLAGLTKKGIKVVALERVRQIGPNKAGAKGSYTIYRVTE
jgi:hypothetical protein